MVITPIPAVALAIVAVMAVMASSGLVLVSTTAPIAVALTTQTIEDVAVPQGTTTVVGCDAFLRTRTVRLVAPRKARIGKVPCRTLQGRTSPDLAVVGASGRQAQGSTPVMRTVVRPSTTRMVVRLQAIASRMGTPNGQGIAEGPGRRTTDVFLIKAVHVAKRSALASTPVTGTGRTRLATTFTSTLVSFT